MKNPILVNLDPNKPYNSFTDTSKYEWSAVFNEEHTTITVGIIVKHQHPITYVCGQFQGCQLNWDAITKDIHEMCMAVKRLSFYLVDAMITLRSDHLPLKRFFQKMTLNAKVNNREVKLSDLNIGFKFIKRCYNILADNISIVINLELTEPSLQEKEDYGYGYTMFEILPDMHVDSGT